MRHTVGYTHTNMTGIDMTILFRQYLPAEIAAAQIGKSIKSHDGTWFCVGHNDLGVLYFAKSRRPRAKRYTCDALARRLVPEYANFA